MGTSSGEHDSYKVWHRPILGREQFSVNELKLYPVSQIGVKHTKVSGIHKWYFHISLCTSGVYSLTDRPALQLSSHTYSILLLFCPCALAIYVIIVLLFLHSGQKSPSGWMSQTACPWPVLMTKKQSVSSPRAPQAVASPSMRLRSSTTARKPRRKAAG